jgi:hypothetical protein
VIWWNRLILQPLNCWLCFKNIIISPIPNQELHRFKFVSFFHSTCVLVHYLLCLHIWPFFILSKQITQLKLSYLLRRNKEWPSMFFYLHKNNYILFSKEYVNNSSFSIIKYSFTKIGVNRPYAHNLPRYKTLGFLEVSFQKGMRTTVHGICVL